MRTLNQNEIQQLQQRGCTAQNWNNILVANDFNPNTLRNVQLYGHIEIGSLNGTIDIEEGFTRQCTIANATLKDVTICDQCLIENIRGYISGYYIGAHCYIADIGIITAQEGATFGQGATISVLNEGGDGNIVLTDTLTAQTAWMMINYPSVIQLAKRDIAARGPQMARIGNNARIVGAKEITNTIIGDGCEIKAASRIANSTILSNDDAATFISTDTIIEDTIVAAGASITDGAKIISSYIGESVHIGKGFSAEASIFFANSHMDNGEACAAFCGPFTTSHHKSTLLIAGAYSFYNAGSGTNQSNHAYKMGPIHWGTLARGSKTASACHILWPATIGTFTMTMGKITTHPNTTRLPFSYIIADANTTWLVPGINIATVGTWRDITKWPRRDIRPLTARQDIINHAFPNPYIIQSVIEGKEILKQLQNRNPNADTYHYNGCQIKQQALQKGIQYYDLAIRLFLHHCFAHNRSETTDTTSTRWLDLMGMLAPQTEIESVERDVANGTITTIAELQGILIQIHNAYEDNEQAYANYLMQTLGNSMFIDRDHWMKTACEAHQQWLAKIKADAEKEYQMGDVEDEQLRHFLTTIQ